MTSQVPGNLAATVGGNIRTARDRAGLTQRQLAERLAIDAMLVSKWERGRHRPSDTNLLALAEELADGDVSWFYVGHEPTETAA